MIKGPLNLAITALIATLPNLSTAQSVATSLSVSFGENDSSITFGADGLPTEIGAPNSLSFASASGPFAVASSVANQNATGAIAGASDNVEFAPFANVTFNTQANAYETNVTFSTQN